MPITGEVDISGILEKLGDPTHGLSAARPKPQDKTDEIFRAAYGQTDMSTSVALAVIPKFIWDVNGYYRQLDISWPYTPTKLQLREGFQRVDGHGSDRTTYYMKQLLDKEVREEYDKMPLGSHFHDRYTTEQQMRKLAQVAAEMSEQEGTLVTVDKLMEEFEPIEEGPETPSREYPWDWGFYSFQSRKYDTEALESWQAMLIAEFAKRKITTKIAIGYVGNTSKEFVIQDHNGETILFLNETVNPTTELTETAVSKFNAHRSKGNK